MKLAVLKGGPSAEREVSLRSGAAVAEALRNKGHDVTEVDVQEAKLPALGNVDAAFIALHGTFGEDGQIQQLLSDSKMPFTGCGVESSRAAFDKAISKELFFKAGVPTPRSETLKKGEKSSFAAPVVVKPACQGSSVGIVRVLDDASLPAALDEAFRFDDHVLVEQMIFGKELTVGILGDEALPVVQIVPREGFYDYANKYTAGCTDYYCPADLSPEVTARVQAAALAAHRAVGCQVYSRVDVLLDHQEHPYVLEVNTIPGMTATSLLPKSAAARGFDFGTLCEKILELSLEARSSEGISR